MPSFTVVVKDTSPIISYDGAWRAGTSSSDGLADQYLESSFTLTETSGDTMAMQFYGSSVAIIGAKRGNHGNFQVQVDNATYPTSSGTASQDLFNQTLFSADLGTGLHNLTLRNSEAKFFDVDYITFDTSVGKADEQLIVNTFQATHPSFVYSPSSSWVEPSTVGSFPGSTGRGTADPSASATFTFEGDAIALYGPTGPSSCNAMTFQVDRGAAFSSSAQKRNRTPRELLFYAGNLGRGSHSLRIAFQSGISGALVIESADVYTAPSLGGSFGTPVVASNVNGSSTALPQSSRIPTAAIAGLAILAVVAVTSILGCIYLFWRLKRALRTASEPSVPGVPSRSQLQPFVTERTFTPEMGYSAPLLQPSSQPSAISLTQPSIAHASHASSSTGQNTSSNYSHPGRTGYYEGKRRLDYSGPQTQRPPTEVRSGAGTQSISEGAPPEYSDTSAL